MIEVNPIQELRAEFEVPGDKSMSHRAAILAGLSNGVCRIDNYLPSEDCLCTLHAMAQLGASHEVLESMDSYGPTSLLITARTLIEESGKFKLKEFVAKKIKREV